MSDHATTDPSKLADELVEKVAREICEADGCDPDATTWHHNGDIMEPYGLAWLQYKAAAEISLRVALRQSAPGWRPIETAPKDGTEILLYGPCRDLEYKQQYAPGRHVGWWSVDHWATRDVESECLPRAGQPLPAPPADGEETQ